MTQRIVRWFPIFLIVFLLSLFAAAYFAVQLGGSTPAPFANHLAAEKGYGVTINLTQYDDLTLPDTLAAMHKSNLTWLRQPVDWATIEAESGKFNWQPLDQVFTALDQFNATVAGDAQKFRLIAVLQTTPEWARPTGSNSMTPPSELRHFGNFARAFAARYGRQIDFYQIWHEPNLSANWGDTFVDPAAYADMLREAALNIRTADSEAVILTAAFSATLEDGPLNLNELAYLDQLYQAKANRWFDIVAIQPYGLWTKPLDAPEPGLLNFRRAELVRQVMLNHGDADTPVWATAFGWVALPADWAGRPSPWSNDLPTVQAPRTATAISHARQNWPWLGPLLAARWDATGLAVDDPARGFALLETPSILEVVQATAANQNLATVGRYPAPNRTGQYGPGWRFALSRADIPPNHPRTLNIPFEGTRLDLHIHRGLFRGYLWVTVDGQAANALPQNGQGQSYVALYDPLRETDSVTLAQYLPAGRHEAVIEADGGWEQWVLEGWDVYREIDTRLPQTGLMAAGLLAVISGVGVLWGLIFGDKLNAIAKRLWAWSEILIALTSIFGERGQIIVVFGLAAGLYFGPGLAGLIVLALLALFVAVRPDLGLLLTTVSLFFFQTHIHLPPGAFSPVELALALTVAGVIFRTLLHWGRIRYAPDTPSPSPVVKNLKSTDFAALVLVLLALLSTLLAEQFAVAFREWRVVIVESVLFYFLVRLGLDFAPAYSGAIKQPNDHPRWVWRLIDAFVAGAVLQATFALYLYFFTDRSIDAEGVHRALGLGYGSPNNLALMLGRAWPILLTVSLLPGKSSARRIVYGVGFLLTSSALYLTFSKGALLVGLPVAVVAMTVLFGVRHRHPKWGRVIGAAVGVAVLFALALIPFSQTERFRTTFDFKEGSTAFFRIKLWQASWGMLKDFWPMGVGPDNFLYQYRTRYILPEAWQEPDLNHPHNLFLDFGTRLGIGGIVLLLWLQIAYWRNAWHLYRQQFSPLLLGLMGSMVIFLAHGLVDNSYFLVDLAFAFFLNMGIVQQLAEGFDREKRG